jgi:hypothetical protein
VSVDAARRVPRARGRLELAVWLGPAVVVALAQMAAQLVDFQLYDLHLRALDASSDASAVAWLTPAGIALALAGTVACAQRHSGGRARRALIAALLVGLLVVASARRGAFGAPLSLHGSTLMLAPALALLLALLLVEARETDVTARRLLRIGCALLVASYVLHLLGGALADAVGGEHSWAYQVGSALIEGTEVAGWLTVGLGCCRAAAPGR